MHSPNYRVYLMRGLPGCGKSHRARQLAGSEGVVLETDEYFYSHVGDDPTSYDYHTNLLETARNWNFDRFRCALKEKVATIVVDRGNGLNRETQQYALLAFNDGYEVQLAEPDSTWWAELRVLLKYKRNVDTSVFDDWSVRLAQKTVDGHRVPAKTIRRWMKHWRSDLTIEDILRFQQSESPSTANAICQSITAVPSECG